MIEYKIAAIIWLIACTMWFFAGYALGEKRGRKKGFELASVVYNEARDADEAFTEKGTFPNAADSGNREEKGVAVVAEQTDNPICRMRCGNNNREENYDSRKS